MATLFGRVDTFEENTETWKHYTERPGHYFDANIMVLCSSQIEASTSPPPGIPRAFDDFSCPGGREFDHYSKGVGNLITGLDIMLRVALIPRGLINHGGDGGDKL